MLEILKTLKDTPLPIVLVIGGLIFLLIPFIQKISSKEVGVETTNQSFAGIIGFVLLVTGIGLYIVPSGTTTSTPPTAIPPVVVLTESPIFATPNSQVQPTTPLQIAPTSITYCYGQCWTYDDNARTMTWTGSGDGIEDIWQPAGEPLQKIRSGYTAIITTNVPGEIFACILSVDGKSVKNSCDGILYQISAGTYKITSASNDVGGFRWCPAVGYGYRADGSGACR
jgi:hypothetical protein